MRPFAVAGVQMHVVQGADNVSELSHRVDALLAHFPWVEMVVFSELAASGYALERAETLPGPTEDVFRALASRHDIWLIPGSVYERAGEHVYNTTSVIAPSGDVVGRYRKMFPFLPYEAGVSGGTEPLVFDVPDVGRFGVSICYDLWFPETARWLAWLGAEVILHPSLTDTIDRDVELSIVRSTAAQNQCYVLDVNGTGAGGNGRSAFAGPAGELLHLAGSAAEDIPLELDLDRVSRGREVGSHGLGQPLKSFRDREVQFPIYGERSTFLDTLGPLRRLERGDRAGIDKERR